MLDFLSNVLEEKVKPRTVCGQFNDSIQACYGCDAECTYACDMACADYCQGSTQDTGDTCGNTGVIIECQNNCVSNCYSLASIIAGK